MLFAVFQHIRCSQPPSVTNTEVHGLENELHSVILLPILWSYCHHMWTICRWWRRMVGQSSYLWTTNSM